MPFVAELYFDPSTEERIRKAWQALDEVGISDSMPKGGYRPHISLGICNYLELDAFVQELSAFAADIMPFRLPFPNIGIFSTSEGVVYWGATATKQLLDLHTKFHEIFKKYAKEQREYYTVGQWVPHCTLAFGLSEGQIAEAVTSVGKWVYQFPRTSKKLEWWRFPLRVVGRYLRSVSKRLIPPN